MDGAKHAVFSGLDSTNEVQASYPQCTVTVTQHGDGAVTIYSTSSGGALANPFTANTNGQWLFYVPDTTTYDVTLSGGTPDAFPAPVVYYSDISPSGGGGSSGGSVKPAAADGLTFVAPEGNDTNDCLSWGSACLTLLGAYNKLSNDGGTIYITSGRQNTGPQCTPVTGQGLAFAGPADPGYASMPELIGSTYWVKAKGGFAGVTFFGASGTNSNNNSVTTAVTPIQCGGDSAPGFQTSNVTGYTWQNLSMFYPRNGFYFNIDSTGDATGTVEASSDLVVDNVIVSICNSCSATPGPTIWIGGNILWMRLTNLALQGNAGNATAFGRAAIAQFTNAGLASGLIYAENIHTTGGGNYYFVNDATTGTQSFTVKNMVMEGSAVSSPVIDIEGTTGFYEADIYLNGGPSDSAPAPWVHVPAGVRPYQTILHGVMGQDAVTVDGPAYFSDLMRVGGINAVAKVGGFASANVAPQAFNDAGTPLGRALAQVDTFRRSFAPSYARYTNLASQLPGTWTTTSGDVTLTTGRTGPDGTTNAAKVLTTSTGGAIAYTATLTWAPGDYLYAGVWARPASTAGPNTGGITDSAMCVCFPFSAGPTWKLLNGSYGSEGGSVVSAPMVPQTDGEWQWLWSVGKAGSMAGGFGMAGVRLQLQALSGQPMDFYAPVVVRIPASSVALISAPVFSSGTESGNTVTIGTTGAHALTPAEPVVISGCTPTGYNGEQVIVTTPLTTSFTYYTSNTGLGAASGCVITPGNDSEVADWAMNAASWADGAPAGTVSTLRKDLISFGGTTNFWGTLSHANTANRTYTFPDATGNLCDDGQVACFQQSFQSNDGSAAVPGYSFVDATSSGMFFLASQLCFSRSAVGQMCTNGGPGITSSGTLCTTTDTRCLSSKTASTSLEHYLGVTGGAIMFALPLDASDPSTTGWTTGEKGGMLFNTTSNLAKYWDGSALQDFGPKSYSCGTTTTCANTNVSGMRIIVGTAPLDNASPSKFTITAISPAFTSTATYTCWTYDTAQHLNDVPKFAPVSGSSFTFTTEQNTLTDTMSYGCIGY